MLVAKDFEGWVGWAELCSKPTFSVKDANVKKQQLLEIARSGADRPHQTKHPLGRVLCHYLSPKSKCYAPEFIAELRKIAPKWLSNQSVRASQKKKQLLRMAKNGDSKPIIKKHPLGTVLHAYTNPNSQCYDSEFTEQIKLLVPDWFMPPSERSKQRKKQLLTMAKNGEPRPHYKNHPLGQTVYAYTNPKHGCYDKKLADELKKLAPEWFARSKSNA